ncbi:hypothetical protein PIB30_095964 [Stylosanthes scabra]|uniref:Uncharacterized protein n=1 Tax=Stylosanthes scabra TaxID=79078 RepID=A0ABU6YW73_9FABA|nr:hypothetical protein [Stylosanthes scabra]
MIEHTHSLITLKFKTEITKSSHFKFKLVTMSVYDAEFIETQLSKRTFTFSLRRLWVLIGILIGVFTVFSLFLLSLCFVSRRNRNHSRRRNPKPLTPLVSKEIQEVISTPPPNPQPHQLHLDIAKTAAAEQHSRVVAVVAFSSGESTSGGGSSGREGRSVCETTSSFGSVEAFRLGQRFRILVGGSGLR